jgi:hypothetical protein
MSTEKLTAEELAILDSYEAGELRSALSASRKTLLERAVMETIKQ